MTAGIFTRTRMLVWVGRIGQTGASKESSRGCTASTNGCLSFREAFYRWRIIPRMLVDTNTRDLTSSFQPISSRRKTSCLLYILTAELFGHTIPAPILFAPIGINKLYSPQGELIPAKIAGELGLPVRPTILKYTSTLPPRQNQPMID